MPVAVQPKTDQELSDIASYGNPTIIDRTGYPDSSTIAIAAQRVSLVRENIAAFRMEVQRTKALDQLSPIGKAERLAGIGRDHLGQLDKLFEPLLTNMRRELDQLKGSMKIAPASTDAAAEATLAVEIRGRLPNDLNLVNNIFFDAINRGDQRTFLAIKDAPQQFNLLPPEVVAMGASQWLEKTDPAKSKLLRDLSDAIKQLSNYYGTARETVRSESGLPARDPIAEIAAGGSTL